MCGVVLNPQHALPCPGMIWDTGHLGTYASVTCRLFNPITLGKSTHHNAQHVNKQQKIKVIPVYRVVTRPLAEENRCLSH